MAKYKGNLIDGRVVELDPKYQLVVDPSLLPAIDIPTVQQQVHDEQELPPEERHDHLEIGLFVLGEEVELSVKNEQDNQHN